MKKIILSILALASISIGVNAQNVNIPDANFKAYLVGNAAINTNSDTEIQVSEASAFSGGIVCSNESISDLTGIEAFTSLQVLECEFNSLTSLDLSSNVNLIHLETKNNNLTSLNLTSNNALTHLSCEFNDLTSIDVSNNTNLLTFYCYYNDLTTLNTSNNTSLDRLYCYNNSITSLDLSNNTQLDRLYCYDNPLTAIDISSNVNLTRLNCKNSPNLTNLNVANGNNTSITDINASNSPNLTCVKVDDLAYSNTNWAPGGFNFLFDSQSSFSTNCAAPCVVNIPDANFKAYLVGNTAINTNGDTEIQCSEASAFSGTINVNNQSISDLTGIEAFVVLETLNCTSNSITTLDVSNIPNLRSLYAFDNSLSSIDLTSNTGLVHLTCGSNPITTLDVSSNLDLETINCVSTLITTLDLTNNTALEFINAEENSLLTSLNAANGNNTILTGFQTWDCPNLTCITVDDVTFSNANWSNWPFSFDAQTSFSTNCNQTVLVNSISVQGQGNVSTITTPAGTLQMEATVLPANADDDTYTWSVANGTGAATIDANGLLTAIADGTVTVTATANDASGVTGSETITISNQSAGLTEFDSKKISIYPNPVQNNLFIELEDGEITEMSILDFSGKVVRSIKNNESIIDASDLQKGVYILKVVTDKGVSTQRFIKQ